MNFDEEENEKQVECKNLRGAPHFIHIKNATDALDRTDQTLVRQMMGGQVTYTNMGLRFDKLEMVD